MLGWYSDEWWWSMTVAYRWQSSRLTMSVVGYGPHAMLRMWCDRLICCRWSISREKIRWLWRERIQSDERSVIVSASVRMWWQMKLVVLNFSNCILVLHWLDTKMVTLVWLTWLGTRRVLLCGNMQPWRMADDDRSRCVELMRWLSYQLLL